MLVADELKLVSIHLFDSDITVDVQPPFESKPLLLERWNCGFDVSPHNPSHIVEFNVAGGCPSPEHDQKQFCRGGHRAFSECRFMALC